MDATSASAETQMVARENYRRENAGDLLRYIDQSADRGLRDEVGRRLSNEEKDRFVGTVKSSTEVSGVLRGNEHARRTPE